MDFAEFILAHDGEDLGRLALARDRFAHEVADFDLALNTLEARRKLRDKVPQWWAVPSLRYPLRLSAEQCSSAFTARYKAAVAAGFASHPSKKGFFAEWQVDATPHPSKSAQNEGWEVKDDAASRKSGQKCGMARCGRIADLTGGLGVDCWAFAQVFEEVLYNEMRPELAAAAEHNFKELGLTNVQVRNCELVPGGVAAVLGDFRPDVIFLDPARRAADGRKVFRLEDCQPDVLQLLPELLDACPKLILKLSPMADITLVCKQLGCVREVHVVATDGECKELLLLLEKGYAGGWRTVICESGAVMRLPGNGGIIPESSLRDPSHCVAPNGRILWAPPSYEAEGGHRFGDNTPIVGQWLFESGKAMMKAGAFGVPCGFGLEKLGQHTHYYVGDSVVEELVPFGKWFQILEVAPLNNRTVKDLGKRFPQAEVTARNIPLSSDQLRAKLKAASGGQIHIFGLHIDSQKGNFLLICQKRILPAPLC